jgi:methyl-accepting chemotaxis protein
MDHAVPTSQKKKSSKAAARAPAGKAAVGARGASAKQASVKIPPIQTLSAEAADARSRQMLSALMAFAGGDFTVRLPSDWSGVDARIAEAFNQSISNADRITCEAARLSNTVGKEGRLTQRISAPGAVGSWATQVDSFNTLIDDLVRPTNDIARTIGAVAKGDLGQPMDLQVDGRPLKGEFLRSAKLVNTMIEQLSVFTSEVTRVAREVGTEGKLGGQAM